MEKDSMNSNHIIPLNYSIKAISDIDYVAKRYKESGNNNMSAIAYSIKDLLGLAEHFLMPDSGRYTEDPELKQENMDMFKLPYPVVAAEFTMNTASDEKDDLHVVPIRKRIALAFEVNTDNAIADDIFSSHGNAGLSGFVKNPGAIIWPVDWHSAVRMWMPSYCGVFIEYDQTLSVPNLVCKSSWDKLGWDTTKVGACFLPIIPDDPLTRSANITPQSVLVDTNIEIISIFQLCTMLNCKNIALEKVQQNKLNKSRIKRGKLPNFEYHVLKVKHSPSGRQTNHKISDRNRPRTHMRRGHIRRLGSGPVWVTHSVINPGHGYIEKDYLI